MQINWLEKINDVRKRIESDPSLVAYMVRDWPITEQAGLSDLAWAMSKESGYVTKGDAKFLLDKLEAHLTLDQADVCPRCEGRCTKWEGGEMPCPECDGTGKRRLS